MKKLLFLAVLTLCAGSVSFASPADYDRQIDAALEDLTGANVDIGQHRFLVRSPEMKEKTKKSHTLIGQIKWMTGGKAEVVSYRILREKGIKSIEVQVNDGMWLPVSASIMQALGDYTKGLPMPEEKQQEVKNALEKVLDGSWRKAAEVLIARIATRHC